MMRLGRLLTTRFDEICRRGTLFYHFRMYLEVSLKAVERGVLNFL